MLKASFETIGTKFEITIWDGIAELQFEKITDSVKNICKEFDNKYSRFKPNSFIRKLSEQVGEVDIPDDCLELIDILGIYKKVNFLTDGQINPLVGNTLADYGYDEKYSLQEKNEVRQTPRFDDVVEIKPHQLVLREKVLIDLGAMGKGYLIDKIYEFLLNEKVEGKNLEKYLVDGSGDIRYYSKNKEEIVCGLEHPTDTTKIIGKLKISCGSLCASSLSRRNWSNNYSTKKYHHYFNPMTNNFSDEIIATFVCCLEAKFADILSSALFFTDPEKLLSEFKFEYLIINNQMQIKKSDNFNAELF
jgi:thiamine biosynthesis lipoprotein